ncbi:Endochitinase B1 [Lachnellula suecica]|uniref:chitinase n=1 Tax=Lachnellula suecica TaxID=602035 RepID=A0A8T9CF06_9HELO|nr:Endochitinase B1 [Lachnellula suecica]
MHFTSPISSLATCGVALCSRSRPYSSKVSTPASYNSPDSTGKRAVGFFGNWDIYARNFTFTDIPAQKLTHISYAFANINSTTGEVFLSDTWADIEKPYPNDKQNRSLKTLLSSTIIDDEECRTTFAKSAVKLMYDLGFDGLDYDYEYQNSSTQATSFVGLLKKTRAEMDTYTNSSAPFLLTADGIAEYLDFWNFMGFDYSGSWNTTEGYFAGHAQNLYASIDSLATPFNTSTAIDYYISNGVSASKINLGNPLYAHAFLNTDGPGSPFIGSGNGSFEDTGGVWNYNQLPLAGSNATVIEIEELGASYSYDSASKTMMSYDTPAIASQKAQCVIDQGLGGAMWWEISMDKTGDESLVGATVETFGQLETSQNRLD